MPQLLSRLDQAGWLTPAATDILDPGAPPGHQEALRAQGMELQRVFTEEGVPTRIVQVRPIASRTLYTARAEAIARGGVQQRLSAADVKRSFARISERHPNWLLGFVPELEDRGTVGILVRTERNQPLNLRQLLMRNPYREHPSTLALVLGVTLEQQLVVRDLNETGHLLILGADEPRQRLVCNLLATLLLVNSPAELRLAFAGERSDGYGALANTPFMLGRALQKPGEAQRLLDGLVKEVQRRQQWFAELNVSNISDYNAARRRRGANPLARILLVVDSLTDPQWLTMQDQWTPVLYDLVMNGAAVGIHLMIAADYTGYASLTPLLIGGLSTQVLLKSSHLLFAERVKHLTATSFVDAIVQNQDRQTRVTPVELYAVRDREIERLAAYWRTNATQRVQAADAPAKGSSTGVTDVFNPVPPLNRAQTPEVERPDPAALARAVQALGGARGEPVSAFQQAQALAAYLGWLGVGPLQDVLGLSADTAQRLLVELQEKGVLEPGETPSPRFIRLSDNPYETEQDDREHEQENGRLPSA